jgi:ribosomal protein S18 acetylase RimI-like enzyme
LIFIVDILKYYPCRDEQVFDMKALYTEDRWLAERIGKAAYRVNVGSDVDAAALADLPDKLPFSYAFVRRGFKFINGQAFLAKDFSEFEGFSSGAVRKARPEDKEQVWDIAFNAYSFDRFHVDEKLRFAANEINASWAVNYFTGNRGTDMLVWDKDGVVGGFILLIVTDGVFSIDLIAVDKKFKRQGIARELVACAESKYADCTRFTVVTQLENSPALQLYCKLGYDIVEIDGIFHRHG